jgi:hypothetical protein
MNTRRKKQANEKGEWKCSCCQQWLPSSAYSKNKQQTSGLHYECRACNKARVRGYNIKTKYGIEASSVEVMLEEQNHKCDICFKPIEISLNRDKSNYATRACVDHDHETNKVRGILCVLCNMGLGKFKDDISSLKRAIEYLKKHNG